MQELDISKIQAGVFQNVSSYSGIEVAVELLSFETTDSHVFDLIGNSDCAKKARVGLIWEIRWKEDQTFEVKETHLLYSGEIKEQFVFCKEDYEIGSEAYDEEYADIIRVLEGKAKEFEKNRKLKDSYGFHRLSFVTYEKREDGKPVVKWITAEHVYFENQKYSSQGIRRSKNIGEIVCVPSNNDYETWDIYDMAVGRWRNYEITEHLTSVHVVADVSMTPYGGEKVGYHIDEIYKGYQYFMNEIKTVSDKLISTNRKNKWLQLSGMDIERMDELTKVLMMEAYLKHGVKAFCYPLSEEMQNKSVQEFLWEQDSLVDYIEKLSMILNGMDFATLLEAFMYLKEYPKADILDVAYRFVERHFNEGYTIGKVFLAIVDRDSLADLGAKADAKVCLYDEKTHFVFAKRLMRKTDFSYVLFDEAQVCSVERVETEAYMFENTYEEDGKRYMHAFNGHVIPVRIVGYMEDGRPQVVYANEWC